MKRPVLLLLTTALMVVTPAYGERRFPPPDFESGYTQPPLVLQEYHHGVWEWMDATLLVAGLLLTAWLLHYKRCRKGIFLTGVAALLYFGFYKQGCICPIGSIQNVAFSIADPAYTISFPTIAIFVLPLLLSLFFGRVYCGGVCPLGAIQDLFLFRPIRVPAWLDGALGLLRYLYLGLAVYVVVEMKRFIICEYDPFVGLFRFSGPLWKILLGVLFLLLGLFVARPYCRYLCPYGGLLSLLARWTSQGVRITPANCTNCTLCDSVCPFGAIRRPEELMVVSKKIRLSVLVLTPGLLVLFPVLGYSLLGDSISGLLLGLWFGVVIASKLIGLVFRGKRITFETDNSACLSCGRCYKWCPYDPSHAGSEENHVA
jgi:NosR/NirI family transcriptional regulator, nitrous oxide reductase regulator